MPGTFSSGGIQTVSAALRSAPIPLRHATADEPIKARPFVTISRQGGAGGHTLGQRLVDRLNALDPGSEPWTLWDRQLVEKVAADHHIARDMVESLEEHNRSWMEEFMANFSIQSEASDDQVYRIVATTVRALAQRGRVVIVGRGGVYITRHMPGGVHLRLIAPQEFRVRFMARQLGLDLESAADHVRRLDRAREAFYRRYWPREVISSEAFTLTLNTAVTDDERAVESVIPLVLQSAHVVPAPFTSEATGISEGL